MTQMIFVNLPVNDVDRARAFYEGLGFAINPQFSDENANCVVISETIFLMTLQRDYFQSFSALPVADTRATTSALIALNCPDRAAVDMMVEKALSLGGTSPRPAKDHGFMYQRTITDPDGNVFEPFWMDPSAVSG